MHTLPAKRADRQQRAHWQVSPLVPGTGVVLLALLWLLSAFAGWASTAFCADRGLGRACRAHVAAAVRPSAVIAIAAGALAAAALVAPLISRSRSARAVQMRLLVLSAACWAIAIAVLFALGEAAHS